MHKEDDNEYLLCKMQKILIFINSMLGIGVKYFQVSKSNNCEQEVTTKAHFKIQILVLPMTKIL